VRKNFIIDPLYSNIYDKYRAELKLTRKKPILHNVKSHTREGKNVRQYQRGSGTHRRVSRLVGVSKPKSLTETDIESWFSVVHGDSDEISTETAMTSYRDGLSDVTYDELTNILGTPSLFGSPDYKKKVTWVIKIGDDLVSIYDYKEYKIPLEKITDWSIAGGAPRKDVERLKEYIIEESERRREK